MKNGTAEPHDVRVWCLGNEMDGPWQIGHKTADEYGRLAAETAKAMRLVDPGIELVACGSSTRAMPTFGDWEATVLGHCYDHVDYVSLHAYYEPSTRTTWPASWPAPPTWTTSSRPSSPPPTTSGPAAEHAKRINLSFDEWNVWYTMRLSQLTGDWARRAAADRGRVQRGRRGRGRQPADQPAPARRPGHDRVPGPAGERDRRRSGPSRAARRGGRRYSTRSR